ncbi:MAG: M48 family metallopeptidase [Scytolyngbya sp. HA4215-MV1]|jgi:Zn-dependent protease with chaperone function|nr:M48 family metallopeptidase [Scytolyngbya sp. HA4215-MV1]
MNFFEHQDQARKNTQWLVALFALSVVCIIVAIYIVALIAFGQSHRWAGMALWQPQIFWTIAIPTLLVIAAGSGYKLLTLRQGGKVIAQEMGGCLVTAGTIDPSEQKLLNVVEEMAIAAGISVPAVYVMNGEPGINAFAAGFTPNDAVIGVTRGCIETLSREELQGVIGHEFSHILNGDMRLNLNLVGVLNGILLIYLIGRVLLQTDQGYRSRDNKGNNLAMFGLALIAIGGIGLFFGRLIKSAVSRQREYLADASAVQFTRNPIGISGALRKIANHQYGALVRSPYAEENSHFFFGSALRFDFLGELFATHPPLEKRIQRLEGRSSAYAAAMPASPSANLQMGESSDTSMMGFAGGGTASPPVTAEIQAAAGQVVAQVGTVAPEHFAYAQKLVSRLPAGVQVGIRERQGAMAIVYNLMLDPQNSTVRQQQIEWLRKVEPADVFERTLQLSQEIEQLDVRMRLPLLDLTIPALRQSSATQCQQLFKCVQSLAKIDGQWSLTEFALYMVLCHRLQSCINPNLETKVQYTNLEEVWHDCLVVLSALARVGQTQPDAIAYAFRSGLSRLPGATQRELPQAPPACHLGDVKKSLEKLGLTTPKLKQAIVDACAHTVLLDNTITVQEAELLRAIVITMDCPLPPFLNASDRISKPTKTT